MTRKFERILLLIFISPMALAGMSATELSTSLEPAKLTGSWKDEKDRYCPSELPAPRNGVVTLEALTHFGAKGDGIADDYDAVFRAYQCLNVLARKTSARLATDPPRDANHYILHFGVGTYRLGTETQPRYLYDPQDQDIDAQSSQPVYHDHPVDPSDPNANGSRRLAQISITQATDFEISGINTQGRATISVFGKYKRNANQCISVNVNYACQNTANANYKPGSPVTGLPCRFPVPVPRPTDWVRPYDIDNNYRDEISELDPDLAKKIISYAVNEANKAIVANNPNDGRCGANEVTLSGRNYKTYASNLVPMSISSSDHFRVHDLNLLGNAQDMSLPLLNGISVKERQNNGINITKSADYSLEFLLIRQFETDGISIGTDGVLDDRVKIKSVVSDKNGRQGMTIRSAQNVDVVDSDFANTGNIGAALPPGYSFGGHSPRAGVDIEPNLGTLHGGLVTNNITFRHTRFTNNFGTALSTKANIFYSTGPLAGQTEQFVKNVKITEGCLINAGTRPAGLPQFAIDLALGSDATELSDSVFSGGRIQIGGLDSKITNSNIYSDSSAIEVRQAKERSSVRIIGNHIFRRPRTASPTDPMQYTAVPTIYSGVAELSGNDFHLRWSGPLALNRSDGSINPNRALSLLENIPVFQQNTFELIRTGNSTVLPRVVTKGTPPSQDTSQFWLGVVIDTLGND